MHIMDVEVDCRCVGLAYNNLGIGKTLKKKKWEQLGAHMGWHLALTKTHVIKLNMWPSASLSLFPFF